MKIILSLLLSYILVMHCVSCVQNNQESDDELKTTLTLSETSIIQDDFSGQKIYLDDSLIYAFINETELIGSNTVVNRIISDQSFDESDFHENDTFEISIARIGDPTFYKTFAKDSIYIKSQIQNAKNKLWNLERLNSQVIWDRYNHWSMEHYPFNWEEFKGAGFGCFLDLGIPIFNQNHDIAVIYVGYQCHGTVGLGSIIKYKKVNGKWQKYDSVNLWIS